MELILWRHADAEDNTGAGDPPRELTRKGVKQAERMAAWLDERIDDDWRILVSPAKRTLQTVKPLEREFEVSDAIGTGSDAARLIRVTDWPHGKRNVLVVGHQPTLGEVAAELLGVRDGGLSVRKGSVWWFASRDRGDGAETLLRVVIDTDLLDA
ncbi:MAG TPA: histidine phosphatase family protein [Usitatibacter sp.]|jgi:phosphohistidine phosphatase